MSIKKIGITTGGGDAPGLNAVIRAATLAAQRAGWEVAGIRNGFDGLLFPDDFPNGGTVPLDANAVRGIAHTGGTILGTTNRGNPFAYRTTLEDGAEALVDISDQLIDNIKAHGIDAIVSIGGDGSMAIANEVSQMGVPIIGVPKTIDNDLVSTTSTFGFDTAVSFATECIGRLHSTANSHERVMVVEVMGRNAGWIALHAGVAGSADVILIPEIPYYIDEVARKINERNSRGRKFSIVVVAEGARPVDGSLSYEDRGDVKRLGGIGKVITEQLRDRVENEVRTVVLGHLLRGGTPTARDRLLSARFGAAAIRGLKEGQSGVMVALVPPNVNYVPLAELAHKLKLVPVDSDTVMTARDLGIEFGDYAPRL